MIRTHTNASIQVRLTKAQRELLRQQAENAGFRTLSGYIRSMTLGIDLTILEKLNKILLLLEEKERGRRRGVT